MKAVYVAKSGESGSLRMVARRSAFRLTFVPGGRVGFRKGYSTDLGTAGVRHSTAHGAR